MSQRIREKEKRKQKEGTVQFKLKEIWTDKKPVLLFVLGLVLLMGTFYVFWSSENFKTAILGPVVNANAFLAGKILSLFGFNVSADGANLISTVTNFSVSIKQGCDALEPVAIFTFAVLLFPVSFRSKLPGIIIGIPVLLLLNQFRIISLYVFGIYSPALFKFMHIQGWQVLFILITLLCLVYWIVWALNKDRLKTATG